LDRQARCSRYSRGVEDKGDQTQGRQDQNQSYHLPGPVAVNVCQEPIEGQAQADEDDDAERFGKHAPTKESFVPEYPRRGRSGIIAHHCL
jgi:hypothetical protein